MTNIKNLSYFFLILFISVTFTSKLFLNFDDDFSAYLAFSKLILSNEIIYKDFFSHKGPFFIIYLSIFSKILGFGQLQAWIIFLLTIIFFYSSILFLCKKFNAEFKLILTIIFAISFCLKNLSSNIILDVYLATLIILSFLFLYNFIKTNRGIYLFFSYLILSILIFSRIDMLAYTVGASVYIFYAHRQNILRKFSLIIPATIMPFFFLKIFYKIELSDFINQTLYFNLSYKSEKFGTFLNHLVREQHFTILMTSTILVIFLYVLFEKIKEFELRKSLADPSFIYLMSGMILWILIGSDKPYHVIIILCPILIFIIFNNKIYFNIDIKIKIVFLIISFYSFSLSLLPAYNLVRNNYECISNIPCAKSNLFHVNEILKKYKEYDKIYVLNGNSNFNILSNSVKSNPNNAPFYLMENFAHDRIKQNYDYILNNKNILIVVNVRLLNTKKVKKLIENSKKIDEINIYNIFLTNSS